MNRVKNKKRSASELSLSPFENMAWIQANTIANLEKQLSEQAKIITAQKHQIHLLLHHQYSARSEKLKGEAPSGQLSLFDEVSAPMPEEPDAPTSTTEVKAHSRQPGGGRRPLPSELIRLRQEYTLTEAERSCSCCGELMGCIGEESMEQLEVIPAVMYVIEHVRKKYACKACQEGVKQACQAVQPVPKSLAGPSLLAHHCNVFGLWHVDEESC